MSDDYLKVSAAILRAAEVCEEEAARFAAKAPDGDDVWTDGEVMARAARHCASYIRMDQKQGYALLDLLDTAGSRVAAAEVEAEARRRVAVQEAEGRVAAEVRVAEVEAALKKVRMALEDARSGLYGPPNDEGYANTIRMIDATLTPPSKEPSECLGRPPEENAAIAAWQARITDPSDRTKREGG